MADIHIAARTELVIVSIEHNNDISHYVLIIIIIKFIFILVSQIVILTN